MIPEIKALVIAAVSIGFFHTLFGPDHYLPFIMIAWARKWSTLKTAIITFLCGIGHIGSSVVLGLIGVALGLAVNKLTMFESFRGNIAAWLLIAFGLVYLVWGIRKAYQKKSHVHHHSHFEGPGHEHVHHHEDEHLHIHDKEESVNITPWVLFAIFVFGPCEPLIPLVMYPAAKNSFASLVVVTLAFGTITIFTMLTVVLLSLAGVNFVPMKKMQRFSHAIAGGTILICGLAIQFLGL